MKADVAFPSKRLAVFVDGCYWHACPQHGSMPKTNMEYWASKFERNRARDRAVNAALQRCGWSVLRIWEHTPVIDSLAWSPKLCGIRIMTNAFPSLVAVDLFAGAGGMALGVEEAGFRVTLAAEIDEPARAAYRRNFPLVDMRRDIRELTGEQLVDSTLRGTGQSTITLIFGGPPCQGFSQGGKRIDSDDRNSLIDEFARLVLEARPRFFMLENVPGLLHTRWFLSSSEDRLEGRDRQVDVLILQGVAVWRAPTSSKALHNRSPAR